MNTQAFNKQEVLYREFVALLRTSPEGNIEDIPLYELGVDSLDFFEKILELEDRHGIVIPIEKLENNVTLRVLMDSIA